MGVYPECDCQSLEVNHHLLTLDLAGMSIDDNTVGQAIDNTSNSEWETLAIVCLHALFDSDDEDEPWDDQDISCSETSVLEDNASEDNIVDVASENESIETREPPRKRIKICVRDGKTSWTYNEDAY